MAQASRAITPKDPGGPWGQRIGVNVAGSDAWTLRVTAFVTKRNNPSDWWRYSIVVLNWYVPITLRFHDVEKVTVAGRSDNVNGVWDQRDVTATISFRGQQVQFPLRSRCSFLTIGKFRRGLLSLLASRLSGGMLSQSKGERGKRRFIEHQSQGNLSG